jgi:pimeloyl-ACP methyl ester carboxylesterase
LDRVHRRAAENADGEDPAPHPARARSGGPRIDVIVAGRRLDVTRIAGTAARRPIVLLHEGLGSIELWRDFPEELAAASGRAVIAYSRAGHGRSEPILEPRPVEYMHDEARIVLPELLRALDVEAPVLFGHSDGASIALIYAAGTPGGATALVLEAPHVFVEALTIRSIERARTAASETDLLAKLGRYHADAAATFFGWNDIWLRPDFLDWNITALLPSIRVPVLLLQGRDDEYGTPAQLTAIAEAIPDTSTVLFADCGHSPHRSHAALVLERTRAFLDALA